MIPLTTRVSFRKTELLSKGTNYTFQRLKTLPYTPDVIEHLIRYHFGTIESNYEKDEEILTIWCDLTCAIESLPPEEKRAIKLMISGYKIRDIQDGIAPALKIRPDQASRLVKKAYIKMSKFLLGDNQSG